MKPPYEKLKLVDIVPGKPYILRTPENELPIQLITFMCSEQRGAFRGFVNLLYDGREIFPNAINKFPWKGLRVIAYNTENITYQLAVEYDRYSGGLVLSTKSVLVEPNIEEMRHDLDIEIRDLQRKIDKLREACEMLDKV